MKAKILFVDDEPEIIAGLKRMLFSFRNVWNISYALSGQEALELLSHDNFNIVVTDMKMPGMNGVELLAKVKKHYPQVFRFILSGHIDEKDAVKACGVAHQFISKPAATDQIKGIIEKSLNLKNYIENEDIVRIISGIGELPGLSEVYLQIENEMEKENVSLDKIANLISVDLSLTAKILQLVNSSFFGLNLRITNLNQALSYLGLNTLKAIIIHVSLFSLRKNAELHRDFFKSIDEHCLNVAFIAKKIMSKCHKDKSRIDEAFISGIVHDAGKIILCEVPNYYDKVTENIIDRKMRFDESEKEIYGFTHAEVGAYLLGLWGLPTPIVEAAAFHHCPKLSGNFDFTPLTAVHLADSFIRDSQLIYEFFEQENAKSSITDNSELKSVLKNVDFEYIEQINLEFNLTQFMELYLQIPKDSFSNNY